MDFARGMSAGVTGGVLALINVSPLPIIAFAFLFPALKNRPPWAMAQSIAVATVVLAIVVAPWLVRNALVFHTFVPLRSNSGYEVFQGNNEVECIREAYNAPHPAIDRREFEQYTAPGEIRYCKEALGRATEYRATIPGRRFGARSSAFMSPGSQI